MGRKNKLSGQQIAFCQNYVLTLSAVKAAAAAGYSPSVQRKACVMLAKPHIDAEIKRLLKLQEKRHEVDAEAVLSELGNIAFANPVEYMRQDDEGHWHFKDPGDLTPQQQAAVKNVRIRHTRKDGKIVSQTFGYDLLDKQGALETLAKHYGLLRDKLDVTVTHGEMEDVPHEQLEELMRRFQDVIEGEATGVPNAKMLSDG